MSSTEWAQAALQAFDQVVQSTDGFRGRPGQRSMAEQVAQTFSSAELGKPEDEDSVPVRAIAVIQAGTGVGKSLAYCAPAIALTKGRGRYICKLKLERLAGTGEARSMRSCAKPVSFESTPAIAGGRIPGWLDGRGLGAHVSIHARSTGVGCGRLQDFVPPTAERALRNPPAVALTSRPAQGCLPTQTPALAKRGR